MNKTKAVMTLAITIIVIAGISGGYVKWMDMMKHTPEEKPQQISDELIYPSATRFDYFTFLVYYTSNMPLGTITPIEFVNLDCPVHVIKTDIRVRGNETRIGVWVDDCLSVREMKNSFTNNTKILFTADNFIPPIECDLEGVEYVGYDCLLTILGDEHGGVCYDLGRYNLTFQIPPPVYKYEVEVLSNIEIGAVEASFFNFETISFSDETGKFQPISNWHYYAGTRDMGDIYFVQVAPQNATYLLPKTFAPELITTTSNYEEVDGKVVELITHKYEVGAFFEALEVVEEK